MRRLDAVFVAPADPSAQQLIRKLSCSTTPPEGVPLDTYAYFDGDNIGSRLELLLLDEKVSAAQKYSQAVSDALEVIKDELLKSGRAKVLIAGGDDLLACWPRGTISLAEIDNVRETFFAACGQTVSVGVGPTARIAALNLRRAKLLGKSRTVHEADF